MEERVQRFSLEERVAHWCHAVFTVLLLATGLSLYLPLLSAEIGNREILRSIHLLSAVGFILLPATALFRNREPLLKDVKRLETWEAEDFEWLMRSARNLLGSKLELPAQGKFTVGMKLNSVFTLTITIWLSVTGALILLNEMKPLQLQLAESAVFLHDLITFILIPVLLGHIAFALLYPEALRGMILGHVSAEYARKRHAKWVEGKQSDSSSIF